MKTILLIEEDEIMRENTREILELSNYQVFSVKDGKGGLEMVKSKVPDIIIYDMVMPGKERLDLLKKLREKEKFIKIPFILISTIAETADLNSGLRKEADVILSKPFKGAELLRVVEKCLQDTVH